MTDHGKGSTGTKNRRVFVLHGGPYDGQKRRPVGGHTLLIKAMARRGPCRYVIHSYRVSHINGDVWHWKYYKTTHGKGNGPYHRCRVDGSRWPRAK